MKPIEPVLTLHDPSTLLPHFHTQENLISMIVSIVRQIGTGQNFWEYGAGQNNIFGPQKADGPYNWYRKKTAGPV